MRFQALGRLVLGATAAATLVAGMSPLSAADTSLAQNDLSHQDRHAACTVARQSNAQALAEARNPVQREAALRSKRLVRCDNNSTGQIAALAVVASAGALGIALLAKDHGHGHGRGKGLSR